MKSEVKTMAYFFCAILLYLSKYHYIIEKLTDSWMCGQMVSTKVAVFVSFCFTHLTSDENFLKFQIRKQNQQFLKNSRSTISGLAHNKTHYMTYLQLHIAR